MNSTNPHFLRSPATRQPMDPTYLAWLDQCEQAAFGKVTEAQRALAEARRERAAVLMEAYRRRMRGEGEGLV